MKKANAKEHSARASTAHLPEAENLSVRIDHLRAIRKILEEMIGKCLPDGNGLDRSLADPASIPDFDRHLSTETYPEITARVDDLKRMNKHANQLLRTLVDTKATFSRLEVPISQDDGFSFFNIVKLNGIWESAANSVLCLWHSSLRALEETEAERRANFPRGPGRRRDPARYRIASDLARFYVKHRKERPTYGFGDGKVAGDYMRALQALFGALGISGDLKKPAKEAVNGITEEELNRAREPIITLGSPLRNPTNWD